MVICPDCNNSIFDNPELGDNIVCLNCGLNFHIWDFESAKKLSEQLPQIKTFKLEVKNYPANKITPIEYNIPVYDRREDKNSTVLIGTADIDHKNNKMSIKINKDINLRNNININISCAIKSSPQYLSLKKPNKIKKFKWDIRQYRGFKVPIPIKIKKQMEKLWETK